MMLIRNPILLLIAIAWGATLQAEQPQPSRSGIDRVFEELEAGRSQSVVVYGTSVSIGGAWAKELESYFQRLYPDLMTFHNAAQSGMHSRWGVENLKSRVLSKTPDLVFIEFAINDAATKHGISTEECHENLDLMVQSLRKQNPHVAIVLQTMNPAWDSPSVPKSFASDRPQLSDYYQVYRDYAKSKNLPLVDNYRVWDAFRQRDAERFHAMIPDGIHPHSDASRQVAWPPIKALLDQARAFAGGLLTTSIWPEGKMPGSATTEPESIRTPERTDAIRITNVSEPTLTLYPAASKQPTPAMIICPGGGYGYVVVDKEGTEIARWLNSIGISVLVLKYRVPNNREGALQDLHRSIRVVRARAEDWNIDSTSVGVIGFSAGGNLAAKASTLFDQPAYQDIDAIDELSCRPDFTILVYPAYLNQDNKVADDLNLAAKIPPTLVIHNDDDTRFVKGSKIFAAALQQHKHTYRAHFYQTGGHGYGLRSEGEAQVWPEDAEKWLRESKVLSESR